MVDLAIWWVLGMPELIRRVCYGTGRRRIPEGPCDNCGGSGRIHVTFTSEESRACPMCFGKGTPYGAANDPGCIMCKCSGLIEN